ncbi:MAG TPA: hypothetical protein VF092_29885 [Longimicrobium sp.]
MSSRIAIALAASTVAALACARPAAAQTDSTTSSTAVTVQQPNAQRPRIDRNLLTPEEIEQRHDANAYEMVRALRPGWLRGVRGASGLRSATVVVYRDGMRIGGVSALTDISIESVKEIRFYNATDATQRWGTDHGAGAIFVVTR